LLVSPLAPVLRLEIADEREKVSEPRCGRSRDHTAPAEAVLSMGGCLRARAFPAPALVVPNARRGSVRSRAMPPAAASSGGKKRKMVALHGKGGNAAGFELYMQPLVAATAETWEWDFVEGPHSTGGDGRAWWNLPPGVRTFEATELEGIEESLALLDARAPFDGVMGFSQGAMLAAVACGRGLKGGNRPSVAIIVGAAFPTARGEDVRKLMRVETAAAEADGEMRNAIPERFAEVVPPVEPLVRSLHVVGKQDTMNPPAQAMRVAEAFFCAELLEHPGGHIVPMDERAMRAYVDAMR
jgi:predicted esterase